MTQTAVTEEFPVKHPPSETTVFAQRTHFNGDLTVANVGDAVTINGWVSANRDLGGIVFVEIRDRSGILQVVADPSKNPEVHGVLDTGVGSERPGG